MRRPRGLGRKPVKQRIAEKIVHRNRCWIWQGAKFKSGYGQIRVGLDGGKLRRAHVVAYEEWIAPIPDGLELDHCLFPGLCAGPLCVNPWHLKPTTHKVNSLRSTSPWAVNKRKTRCKHGHKFTSSNTIIKKNGCRECRTCRDNRLREWHAKHRSR